MVLIQSYCCRSNVFSFIWSYGVIFGHMVFYLFGTLDWPRASVDFIWSKFFRWNGGWLSHNGKEEKKESASWTTLQVSFMSTNLHPTQFSIQTFGQKTQPIRGPLGASSRKDIGYTYGILLYPKIRACLNKILSWYQFKNLDLHL